MTNIQKEIIENMQLKVLAISQPTKKRNTDNIFATDEVCDYLIDFNGNTAVFNCRNSVRNEIVKYFKDEKKFYYSKRDSCGFSLRDVGADKKMLNLSQLIVAEKYPNCRIETIKKSRVVYLDSDKLNLKDDNLEYCRALIKYENKHNIFETIGNELVITHKESGKKFYAHADDYLCSILQRQRWYLQPNGRLVTNHAGVGGSINLSAFIFAYYYLGMKKTNVVSCLKKIKNKKGYVIDHFDDNPQNNRKWNVSMMRRAENTAKSNLVSKFGLPFICNGIYIGDEKYRLVMSHVLETIKNENGFEVKFESNVFEFHTAEQMIRYLQYWYESYYFKGCTPKSNYENAKVKGNKVIRYTLQQKDFDNLVNATTSVVNNLPDCERITEKQFREMVERSSPEIQEQMRTISSLVKFPKGGKGYMFMEALPKDSVDKNTSQN